MLAGGPKVFSAGLDVPFLLSLGDDQAALLQAPRVAHARGVAVEHVLDAIARHTEGRTFGIFGEPRVNVLELNLELDRRLPMK